jgi:acyl-CoA dehydrogenase
MQQALDKLINNFPNRPAAWILRRLVFPLGKTYRGPNDTLVQKCAELILQPCETRERLTGGLFIPNVETNKTREPLARLEYALHCVIAAEPVEKKLRKAVRDGTVQGKDWDEQLANARALGLLSDDEAQALARAETARREATRVDDFEKLFRGQQAQSRSAA